MFQHVLAKVRGEFRRLKEKVGHWPGVHWTGLDLPTCLRSYEIIVFGGCELCKCRKGWCELLALPGRSKRWEKFTTWSKSQLLANSFVLALAPFFFSLFSVWTPLPLSCPAAFHCCKCWSRGHSGCCRPGWTLKGSRSLFFKLLFTGHSFKVSFRNVFLLVVTSTLFEVALGHRRLQGPFWFLARLGFFNLPHDAVPLRFWWCFFVWFCFGWVFSFCYKGICMDHPCIQLFPIPRRYYA